MKKSNTPDARRNRRSCPRSDCKSTCSNPCRLLPTQSHFRSKPCRQLSRQHEWAMMRRDCRTPYGVSTCMLTGSNATLSNILVAPTVWTSFFAHSYLPAQFALFFDMFHISFCFFFERDRVHSLNRVCRPRPHHSRPQGKAHTWSKVHVILNVGCFGKSTCAADFVDEWCCSRRHLKEILSCF